MGWLIEAELWRNAHSHFRVLRNKRGKSRDGSRQNLQHLEGSKLPQEMVMSWPSDKDTYASFFTYMRISCLLSSLAYVQHSLGERQKIKAINSLEIICKTWGSAQHTLLRICCSTTFPLKCNNVQPHSKKEKNRTYSNDIGSISSWEKSFWFGNFIC